MLLAIHIIAGGLALVSGYVAMFVAKGATMHRRSGMVFVGAMLVMVTTGGGIAAWHGNEGSTIGAVMTFYFVLTAAVTVRRPAAWTRRFDIGLTLVALAGTIASFVFAVAAITSPTGLWKGLPPFPFFMFGTVGILAIAGDVRMLRSGLLRGAPRLTRHLWRMCWAMWIAAGSFFFGQAKVIPEPIRKPALLAVPVLAVFAVMFYWLWRVRVKRSLRGMVIGRRATLVDSAVTAQP